MTATPLTPFPAAVRDYAQLWADSAARVLEQLHGSPFANAAAEDPVENPAAAPSIYVEVKASGRLSGATTFVLDASTAVRLTQLLMSEPLDASVAFADGHKDALAEIFRQFAGIAATAAKSKYGAAVEFTVTLIAEPPASSAHTIAWTFTAPPLDPLTCQLALAADAAQSIEAAAAAAPPASATAPPAPAPVAAVGNAPENLGLLLDVTLDAHLRFGQRQMLLREILDLRAGSVVELDRRLQEPAELLVSGRVVARGEVVIVDGSYGIRITDIVQPQQRLTSLKA